MGKTEDRWVAGAWVTGKLQIASVAVVALITVWASPATSAAKCSSQFLHGAVPVIERNSLSAETQQLCYLEFAVLFSGRTRTPLWSAEYLTEARADADIGRHGNFRVDRKVPAGERSELADYSHSGFDRGHMVPSDDVDSRAAQAETFYLTNVVPQTEALNRGTWKSIEDLTRALAEEYGAVYVVTGPIFAAHYHTINGRVAVPTQTYKAIFVPATGLVGAYIADNVLKKPGWEKVSIDQLTSRIGIDVFPDLPAKAKAAAPLMLPDLGRLR